ncbi:MAG TPA: prolyl oligopeptidase family serine peptidase, partial [Methanospirillum sp.]|uniref:alpha/beta hydrolase family protein n=1 Tax=Methanospirillum sp. TaxID=45200 RepID=UPI002C09C883
DEVMTRIEGYQDENEFAWSPDSSMVYIERNINGGIHYPVRYASDIVVYIPETRTREEIPLQWEKKLHNDLFNEDIEITPFNGGVYVFLANGTNPQLARYDKTDMGWIMTLLSGEHQGNIFALEAAKDGSRLYYNYNSASVPPQIYAADVLSGEIRNPEKLTNLNKNLQQRSLGTSEVIEWTGAQGDTVQGILRYPPGYTPGTPYPLIVVIHGGPTYTDFDSWRDTWEFPYHLITDRGAITLSTNYHGSSNWGFAFAQSIEGGHIHDLPIEDFMKGIEHLSQQGIIDKNRVGVTGWSNGGILTLNWITQDPSLKVAVAGAGYADENSQVSNTNGIVMNRMYHEYSPFENPEYYLPIMGVYNAENVKTPLLMLQGTEDDSVAPASALSTYRAYKMASNADVRMILFKDQPHHMKTYPNQLRKVSEEIDWLSKGLGLT